MFSSEAATIAGVALSSLIAVTGFLSAQAFLRLTRELDRMARALSDLEVKVAVLDASCRARHRESDQGD